MKPWPVQTCGAKAADVPQVNIPNTFLGHNVGYVHVGARPPRVAPEKYHGYLSRTCSRARGGTRGRPQVMKAAINRSTSARIRIQSLSKISFRLELKRQGNWSKAEVLESQVKFSLIQVRREHLDNVGRYCCSPPNGSTVLLRGFCTSAGSEAGVKP